MLSISAMSSGSGGYYLNLAREDYYLKGGEPKGHWIGKGADALQLSGDVAVREFQAVFKGFLEDGKPLTQNAGEKSRQPGWDLTFSAPKPVSVLWSQGDGSVHRKIQAAHQSAVKAALTYLEEEVGFSRRGKGGLTIERAGLVIATFEHGVSRDLDPQLHTHALVMNAGVRADGTTGTILSKPLYQHKMVAGALYRAELASQLEERLGVRCERDKDSFSIRGVPSELCKVFSQRRDEILEKLSSRGQYSAAASAAATLETRRTKQNTPPRADLFEKWKEKGKEFDFDWAKCVKHKRQVHDANKNFSQALKAAVRQIVETHSHFDKKLLLQKVAIEAQVRNISASTIRNQVDLALHSSKNFASLTASEMTNGLRLPQYLNLRSDLLRAVMPFIKKRATVPSSQQSTRCLSVIRRRDLQSLRRPNITSRKSSKRSGESLEPQSIE